MQQVKRSGGATRVVENADVSASLVSNRPHDVSVNRDRGKKETLKRDWAEDMGSGAHGTAGVFPAKYGFSTAAATCSDYVVFPTSVAGSSTVPNIIAYNSLYVGTCTDAPSVFWAASFGISGGTYGTVTTSPVLSYDGSEVAFMETISGHAYLVVVLMPNAGDTSVVSITCPSSTSVNSVAQTGSPQAWCAEFADGDADTRSSPFYDYTHNVLYVGDNSGKLHKFGNVFKNYSGGSQTAAPSEVTGGTPSWPITVTTTTGNETLSSPVYDSTSGNIFIGESWASGHPASLVQVSSGGVVTPSNGTLGGYSIVDAPLVDSSAETVYAFIGNDNSSNCSGGNACSGVYQFPAGSTFGTAALKEAYVGTAAVSGSAPLLYAGTFDNIYYTSANSASPSGHLYVCGDTYGDPILYAITITGNTMTTGAATAGPTLTSGAATCSPVTEVYDGTHDWIFLSVTNNAIASSGGCTAGGGCVYNLNVTSAIPSGVTAGITATSGASGIVIDNIASTTGASQIYYEETSTTTCSGGTGGCAVQTSQSTP
jgi:hypothetical protein